MTMRVPYQDIYFISVQKTNIFTTATFTGSDTGMAVGKFSMLPTNHPNFLDATGISDVPKAVGISQRRTGTGYEYNQTVKGPSVSGLTFEMTPNHLGLFLQLLFQAGCTEDVGSPYKKTAVPYTDSDCVAWASLGRLLDTAAYSEQLNGAVISSMTLTGAASGVLDVSVDFIGYGLTNNANLAAVDTTIPDVAPYLFQNTTVTMAGSAVKLESFSITINNNAERRHYNNQYPNKIILGKLDVSGTIVIPWTQTNSSKNTSLTNFIAGTDVLLSISVGSTGVNESIVKVNMRYTGDTDILTDGNELMLSLPFTGANDGTNNAVEITCEDSVDRV